MATLYCLVAHRSKENRTTTRTLYEMRPDLSIKWPVAQKVTTDHTYLTKARLYSLEKKKAA